MQQCGNSLGFSRRPCPRPDELISIHTDHVSIDVDDVEVYHPECCPADETCSAVHDDAPSQIRQRPARP